MSLLQTPRRPSSDGIVLGPQEGRALATPFGTLHGDEGPQVDLGRELDLAAERPTASGRSERGPGVLVATIVASSLALGGIILALRDDPSPATPSGPIAAPRSAVVTAPAEPAPVPTPTPVEPPPVERVATKTKPAPAPTPATQPAAPAPSEITPAAIAPATPARPETAARPTTPVEPTPSTGLAPGLQLPAPVFDEPAQPEPAQPEPAQPEPTPGVAEPLPGIDERAPAEPADAPEQAAVPTDDVDAPHAVEPLDLLDLDTIDRAPAHADRPAS